MTDLPRLVLVDGTASLYRAFYALPPLTNSRGEPTHVVLGFATMLLKLVREEAPQALAIVFDGPGPTARHRVFAAYKAQRPPTPEGLIRQIPHVHRLLTALRVPALMIPGEEADDILGSMAVSAASREYSVRIVSGDKDLLQVITERILVRDPMKQVTLGPAEVVQRYGIPPARIPDLLALMGDSSDNIPGVPGIGEKTARALLVRYGDLEGVLSHRGETTPKVRAALETHAEQARLSGRLATIRTDLPLAWGIDDLGCRPPDGSAVLALCRELEFSRLAEQFAQPTLGGNV